MYICYSRLGSTTEYCCLDNKTQTSAPSSQGHTSTLKGQQRAGRHHHLESIPVRTVQTMACASACVRGIQHTIPTTSAPTSAHDPAHPLAYTQSHLRARCCPCPCVQQTCSPTCTDAGTHGRTNASRPGRRAQIRECRRGAGNRPPSVMTESSATPLFNSPPPLRPYRTEAKLSQAGTGPASTSRSQTPACTSTWPWPCTRCGTQPYGRTGVDTQAE